jgi:hypothetical protein
VPPAYSAKLTPFFFLLLSVVISLSSPSAGSLRQAFRASANSFALASSSKVPSKRLFAILGVFSADFSGALESALSGRSPYLDSALSTTGMPFSCLITLILLSIFNL